MPLPCATTTRFELVSQFLNYYILSQQQKGATMNVKVRGVTRRHAARALAEAIERRSLLTSLPELVADFNQMPQNEQLSGYAELDGGSAVFTADDVVHGRELWVTDGTEVGTRMLVDLRAGASSSSISLLTSLGGRAIFQVSSVDAGLYSTDGTEAGTFKISSVTLNSSVTVIDGRAYFANSTTGDLYQTDGTIAGTRSIDLIPPGEVGALSAFSHTQGKIYAVLAGTLTSRLVLTDTNFSPRVILQSTSLKYSELRAVNGSAYYLLDDINSPTQTPLEGQWRSRGTASSTEKLSASTWAGALPIGPSSIFEFGNQTYFLSLLDINSSSRSLYRYDEASGSQLLAANIANSGSFSRVDGVIAFGDRLILRGPSELYSFDPANNQVYRLESNVSSLVKLGTKLYYRTSRPGMGAQAWELDETLSGLRLLPTVSAGGNSYGSAASLYSLGGKLVLFTQLALKKSNLWIFDPSTFTTDVLARVSPRTAPSNSRTIQLPGGGVGVIYGETNAPLYKYARLSPDGAVDYVIPYGTNLPLLAPLAALAGDRVIFAGGSLDGSSLMLASVAPGSTQVEKFFEVGTEFSGTMQKPLVLDDRIYFQTRDGIWRTDGTAAGTVRIATLAPSVTSFWLVAATEDGRVIFARKDPVAGDALCITNSSSLTPSLLFDSDPASLENSFSILASNEKFAYVVGTTQAYGSELYRVDLRTLAVNMVADLYPGPENGLIQSQATFAGDRLVFTATTPDEGRELWSTDGTTAGTIRILEINPGAGNGTVYNLSSLGDVALFQTFGSTIPLWRTDGTRAGTQRLVPENVEQPDGAQRFIVSRGNAFLIDDGVVWQTTGGLGNLQKIAEGASPSTSGSVPAQTQFAGGALIFDSIDPIVGLELFKVPAVDLAAPRLASGEYVYDAASPEVQLLFSEAVSLAPGTQLQLLNLTTGTAISLDASSFSLSNRLLTYRPTKPMADGNYRLTLAAGAVVDRSGLENPVAIQMSFRVLTGDVDRDGVVGFDDLLTLAQHYGTYGNRFSGGNVDYSSDGYVGFDDLLLIAQRYGSSLLDTSPRSASRSRSRSSVAGQILE
jgi:ELWxxDGT repeat protein